MYAHSCMLVPRAKFEKPTSYFATASVTKQRLNDAVSARGAFWVPLYNTGPAQLANYPLEMVIQWLLSTGL